MRDPLRQMAIDTFKRGEDEVCAQLEVILARVLERVVPPSDINFRREKNFWFCEIDDVRIRMRHVGTGWVTEVFSPELEWVHFESLASLGAILCREPAT